MLKNNVLVQLGTLCDVTFCDRIWLNIGSTQCFRLFDTFWHINECVSTLNKSHLLGCIYAIITNFVADIRVVLQEMEKTVRHWLGSG